MQIIQQTTRITSQEEVQGVIVMYSYEFEKDQNPQSISFSVQKKVEEQGYYPYLHGNVTNHSFDVQNNSFQPSDIELYKHIHEACIAIINGQSTNDKSISEQ